MAAFSNESNATETFEAFCAVVRRSLGLLSSLLAVYIHVCDDDGSDHGHCHDDDEEDV